MHHAAGRAASAHGYIWQQHNLGWLDFDAGRDRSRGVRTFHHQKRHWSFSEENPSYAGLRSPSLTFIYFGEKTTPLRRAAAKALLREFQFIQSRA